MRLHIFQISAPNESFLQSRRPAFSRPALPTVSVFFPSAGIVALAEMGDKTQIATVALAARYPGAALSVVAGFTLGMMLANAPVVWLGDRLIRKAPLCAIQLACAAIFAALGLAALPG